MLQRAAQDVGDDLHVAMRMQVKPAPARDRVVIDDPQRPESLVVRVVIIGERKRMPRVKPAVVGMAPIFCFANVHHNVFPPLSSRNLIVNVSPQESLRLSRAKRQTTLLINHNIF